MSECLSCLFVFQMCKGSLESSRCLLLVAFPECLRPPAHPGGAEEIWQLISCPTASVSVLPLQEQREHPGHFSELTGNWELEEGKGLIFLVFLGITDSLPNQQSVLLE